MVWFKCNNARFIQKMCLCPRFYTPIKLQKKMHSILKYSNTTDHHSYFENIYLHHCHVILNMRMRNKQNNYKIPSKNGRTRGKVDTPNTQLHDHSLSWQYTYFNKKMARISYLLSPNLPSYLVEKTMAIQLYIAYLVLSSLLLFNSFTFIHYFIIHLNYLSQI